MLWVDQNTWVVYITVVLLDTLVLEKWEANFTFLFFLLSLLFFPPLPSISLLQLNLTAASDLAELEEALQLL